jgi:hypothetical protein
MKTALGQLRDYLNEMLGTVGGSPALLSINNGPLFGNRIKNANKLIAQRATSATVTAGTAVPTASTGYPTIDRFFGYSTGANVTVAQVAGTDATHSYQRYTGAASVTAIGHGTRLEASETAHMAGQTATYTVELANSLLTTVTWTANYATTANTFGTIGTPTKTQIATGTFTVTSTVTKYSTQISLPAGATTGIEIVLTVGAQTSGTWTIGREDFRLGSVSPTVFEVPDAQQEFTRCQRYLPSSKSSSATDFIGTGLAASAVTGSFVLPFQTTARVAPTGALFSTTSHYTVNAVTGGGVASAISFSDAGIQSARILATTSGLTSGQGIQLYFNNSAGTILFTGCEIP